MESIGSEKHYFVQKISTISTKQIIFLNYGSNT
jgi:hypothetical protein